MEPGRSRAVLPLLSLGLALPALVQAATFGPSQAIATGGWSEAVAIGDVTGDGRNDVVLVNSLGGEPGTDKSIMLFAQQADGTLVMSPPMVVGNGTPDSVAVGDVNGDGRNEVVLGNGDHILVCTMNADGTLGASQLIETPYALRIRLGDLNHDGRMDLAGIGWGGQQAGVFLQVSGGLLELAGSYTAPHGGFDDLELGDVNGDGLTDIVVMSGQGYADENVAVLRQVAGGGFAPASFHDVGSNESTNGVGIGDVNGDGRKDVVVSYGGNSPNAFIAGFLQQADRTLGLPTSVVSYDIPESLDVADVTGDGRDDVVVLHGGWRALGLYAQQSGTLGAEQRFAIPYASHYNPHGLAIGDINGDGRPDVVIADYNNGLVYLLNQTPNFVPVAAAGRDRAVLSGRTVRLDGTASTDPDGTVVKYVWRQISGPAVTLTRAGRGVVTFVAPRVEVATRLVFQVKVTDDDGATDIDRVIIRVKPTLY